MAVCPPARVFAGSHWRVSRQSRPAAALLYQIRASSLSRGTLRPDRINCRLPPGPRRCPGRPTSVARKAPDSRPSAAQLTGYESRAQYEQGIGIALLGTLPIPGERLYYLLRDSEGAAPVDFLKESYGLQVTLGCGPAVPAEPLVYILSNTVPAVQINASEFLLGRALP